MRKPWECTDEQGPEHGRGVDVGADAKHPPFRRVTVAVKSRTRFIEQACPYRNEADESYSNFHFSLFFDSHGSG
jgi:hypothetical protein